MAQNNKTANHCNATKTIYDFDNVDAFKTK